MTKISCHTVLFILFYFVTLVAAHPHPGNCIEDENFAYKNEVNKDCAWIEETYNRRQNKCLESEVELACPSSCGLCCGDRQTFTTEINGKDRKCKWISEKQNRKDLYCQLDDVSQNCRATCHTCHEPVSFPSAVPSSSFAPSQAPTQQCVDSATYTYGPGERTCEYIRETEWRRNNFCNKELSVSLNCPETCGMCCMDDPSFELPPSKDDPHRTCSWISELPGRIDKYCNNEKWQPYDVAYNCMKTCENCFPNAVTEIFDGDDGSNDDDGNDGSNDDDENNDDGDLAKSDDGTCVDSTTYTYGSGERTCEYIRETEWRRNHFCNKELSVSFNCPKACGTCCNCFPNAVTEIFDDDMSNDDDGNVLKPDGTCVDNTTYTYGSGERTCEYIRETEWRRNHFCNQELSVSLNCPETCGTCCNCFPNAVTETFDDDGSDDGSNGDDDVDDDYGSAKEDIDCKEDESFILHDKVTCEWLRDSTSGEYRRKNWCNEKEVSEACPITCGLCCLDDEDFRFEHNGKNRKCEWFAKTDMRLNTYCTESYNDVLNSCRSSCGECFETVPTYSPTTTPPTISNRPSTPAPTFSQAPSLGPCVDSDTYYFDDNVLKTCLYIGGTTWRRKNFCPQSDVADNCRASCGVCCGDDHKFTFKDDIGEEQSCAWLRTSEERIDSYCADIDIGIGCRLTCNNCMEPVYM